MTGFDALHPAVQHHIVNTLGWRELRPLQEQAIAPLLGGSDALLLAPTAGGKTEAAMFPLLTRMAAEDWRGTSLLYVCPLRALLNNLEPRIDAYARWLGRRASVRHGDTRPSARKRQLVDRHDVLLTTPESLEALLVSATIDPHVALANVRAVVVDEVHAFAGDDRGWHLLAVLERVSKIAGRPLQRVGLSATVGNPAELLAWLQGTGRGTRSAQVVMPSSDGPSAEVDLQLDYVGSLDNAGRVISKLHSGEKRLVFADSRRAVEQVAVRLRELGAEVHVSHSSLSPGERRRSEQAFAESRNCVITATSTLELGIDVGDLDRVIQIGSPAPAEPHRHPATAGPGPPGTHAGPKRTARLAVLAGLRRRRHRRATGRRPGGVRPPRRGRRPAVRRPRNGAPLRQTPLHGTDERVHLGPPVHDPARPPGDRDGGSGDDAGPGERAARHPAGRPPVAGHGHRLDPPSRLG